MLLRNCILDHNKECLLIPCMILCSNKSQNRRRCDETRPKPVRTRRETPKTS